MKRWQRCLLILSVLLMFQSLQGYQQSTIQAMPNQQQTIPNSTPIYYRIDGLNSDGCGDNLPITLGDFIKKTLPNEWIESWGNTPGGDEALKAGAITIRSWILSADNAEVYTVGGQSFFCVRAWSPRIEFDLETDINAFPHSAAAVDETDGIIMTHPDAPAVLGVRAINAQFRTETGIQTLAGNQAWLVSILIRLAQATTLPSRRPAWASGGPNGGSGA